MRHAYGLVHDRHDDRDFRFSRLANRLGMVPVPASADLRSIQAPVFDQGQLGSCTANALVGLVMALHLKASTPVAMLSRLWLYFEERKREHTIADDAGATLRTGMRVLHGMGCAPETDWPYDVARFADYPPGQALVDARPIKISAYHRVNSLVEVQQALGCMRVPVAIGIRVFASFDTDEVAQTGVVPMPSPDEQLQGGHAVLAVGYDNATGRFLVRNSWGTGWGQEGYFTLPYGYLDPALDLTMDMWTATL